MNLAPLASAMAQALRPSSAGTWIVCGGNVAMRAMFPAAPDEAEGDVCDDGLACHWLADEIWNRRFPLEGSLAPNGRVLTAEMFDAVDLYHDTLRDPAWESCETYCEKKIDCGIIYPGMQGTPDAHTVMPYKEGGRIKVRVVDLKFGFRPVEVWGNKQLIIYAVALCKLYNLPPNTDIELVIVQPRIGHRDGPVRTWRTTLAALQPYIQELQHAAQNAMQPNPPAIPNPGCADCPGRHVCVALQTSSLAALELSSTSVPFELTAEALADELRRTELAITRMKARVTGLRTQGESILRSGGKLPGYELAATYARESWTDGQAIISLGPYFNATTHKKLQPLTPAQARKVLPKAIVALYAHRPSTGVALTQIDPDAARKTFEANPLPEGDNT